MSIFHFFHSRKREGGAGQQKSEPQPLRIEGIAPAPLTPEPDDAELAAQALLELMASDGASRNNDIPASRNDDKGDAPRDVAYYRRLAERIRQAHEAARQRTVRFLAFVEQELAKPDLPLTGPGSLGLLEAELYKRLDVVDRHGGSLKTRWQHCLANVLVRQMQAQGDDTEDTDATTD